MSVNDAIGREKEQYKDEIDENIGMNEMIVLLLLLLLCIPTIIRKAFKIIIIERKGQTVNDVVYRIYAN